LHTNKNQGKLTPVETQCVARFSWLQSRQSVLTALSIHPRLSQLLPYTGKWHIKTPYHFKGEKNFFRMFLDHVVHIKCQQMSHFNSWLVHPVALYRKK
jgi:hypothetical protein